MNFKTCIRFLLAFSVIAGLQLVSAMSARAVTGTWSQTATGTFGWPNSGNWSGGTVPNAIADVANFTTAGGPATQSVTLDLPITIGALTLTNSATSYTISNGSGGPLAFDNGATAGTITMGAGSLAQTINADMTFATPGLVITNNSTNALSIGGTLSGTGTNIYLPNTTAGAGKIALTGNDRLPTNSVLNLFPTTFPATGSNTTYVTSLDLGANNQTLSTIKLPLGSTTDGATTGATMTISGTQTLKLNGDDFLVGIQVGGTGTNTTALTHTVNMSDLSNFVFDNSTKLFGVHFNGGRINFSTAGRVVGALTLGDSSTVNAKSILVGDAGGSNGNGGGRSTLILGSVSNVLNVGSNASDGVINVGYSGRISRGDVALPAGATVSIRGFGGGNAPLPSFLLAKIAGSTTNAHTSTVDFASGFSNAIITQMDIGTAENNGTGGSTTGVFNLGATTGPEHFTIGTLNLGTIFGNGSILAAPLGSTATFTLNHAAGVLNAATINFATNTVVNAQTFAKTVTGTFNLTNGTLRSTTIQLGTQGGSATPVRNLNWATGTIENTFGIDLSISGVPINLSTTGAHTFNATGSNSITVASTSVISGATSGITKTGTGTLVFNATNTYAGDTTIANGTLALGSSGTLGTVGTIVFTGGALQWSGSNTTDYSPRFSTAVSQAYKLDTNGQAVTLATALTSPGGSLTKLGSGTLTLTAANTYSGPTAVNAGTLLLTNASGSGTGIGNITIGNGATAAALVVGNGTAVGSIGGNISFLNTSGTSTATVNRSDDVTYPGNVSGANGTIIKQGAGKLTLTGTNTYGGGTTVSAGTLEGNTTSLQGAILNNAAVIFNQASTGTYAGNMSGSGTLTKNGGGTLILSGTNSHSGLTTVTAGTLLVNGSVTGAVSVTGGRLGGAGSISGAVTVTGGTLAPGASIDTLSAGDLSLSNTSFEWEYNGGSPTPTGATADVMNVGGDLIILSSVSLTGFNLSTTAGMAVATGTKFVAISYAGSWNNGKFTNAPLDDGYVFVDGKQFKIDYNDTNFSGAVNYSESLYGKAVTLTAVPEAGSILVMGLGGVFAIGAVWLGKRCGVPFVK